MHVSQVHESLPNLSDKDKQVQLINSKLPFPMFSIVIHLYFHAQEESV